jgi:hypothetical protein
VAAAAVQAEVLAVIATSREPSRWQGVEAVADAVVLLPTRLVELSVLEETQQGVLLPAEQEP